MCVSHKQLQEMWYLYRIWCMDTILILTTYKTIQDMVHWYNVDLEQLEKCDML